METKKETGQKPEENKKEELKKEKGYVRKSKNFPLGFGVGFLVMGIITAILVSFVLVPNLKKNEEVDASLGLEKAKTKIESFINEVLIKSDDKVAVKEASEESGLYKIVVTASNGQDVETYVTKDGKLFFDRVMDIKKITEEIEKENNAETPQVQEVIKNDKPVVELFVMSHCPYGTQIEKGILPILEILGGKIDFELKFCDYAMHKEKELDEQLRQHCIKTEEPAKFISYLQCFLEADKSDECLKTTKINTSKLNTCVSATDKKYKVTENFGDKSAWKGNYPTFNIYKEDVDKYSVGGSPALVINGTTAKSGRDSASLLATICSGFNNPPEECSTELSSDTPSPGFGFSATKGGDSASCN